MCSFACHGSGLVLPGIHHLQFPSPCKASSKACRTSIVVAPGARASAPEAGRDGNVNLKAHRQRVVICPGFLSGAAAYRVMAQHLGDLGFETFVVPINSWDWYPTLLGASFTFYLAKLKATVDAAMQTSHEPVAVVGHSAGGWLPRVLAGSTPYDGAVYVYAERISILLSLGTPHLSLEAYPFGRVSERRRGEAELQMSPEERGSSLRFANRFYPGAYFQQQYGIPQVCICGDAVEGRRSKYQGTAVEDFAFTSYLATCGQGDVRGDGVCPLQSSFLEGARNITLKDVHHSPGSAKLWYGDPEVVADWAQLLVS